MLAVMNDHAERGVALLQGTAKSRRFRCEDQLQYALQVIELTQRGFPIPKSQTGLLSLELLLIAD